MNGIAKAPGAEILSVADAYTADRAAQSSGVALESLIEAAGRSVAATIRSRWSKRPVAVLCGPGNNGADGLVTARALAAVGWPVRVGRIGGGGEAPTPALLDDAALVVDALFGVGLSRPIAGPAAALLDAARTRGLPGIAVDVPSGVDGDSGEARGPVLPACLTVTFFRRKPAHLLEPGRGLCGEIVVADIGIPARALDRIPVATWANGPALWESSFPWPGPGDHKHSRGHAVVMGGGPLTSGAGRLAARSALRVGAGLATVAVMPEAAAVHAAQQTAVMIANVLDTAAFHALLADRRRTAVLIGPGAGVSEGTRARVLAILDSKRPCVLDADALTVFQADPDVLLDRLHGDCLLTPHEGEFARLFAMQGDKLARARAAARRSGAVVLLKGSDTVIAAPDGQALICEQAPAALATAGSGDVLAGLALGLMAQGTGAMAAAGAACWLHAAAAEAHGPGLISEDLVEALPTALHRLRLRRKADHG